MCSLGIVDNEGISTLVVGKYALQPTYSSHKGTVTFDVQIHIVCVGMCSVDRDVAQNVMMSSSQPTLRCWVWSGTV